MASFPIFDAINFVFNKCLIHRKNEGAAEQHKHEKLNEIRMYASNLFYRCLTLYGYALYHTTPAWKTVKIS